MQTVLNEIAKLRLGAPIVIDYHNSNRYRLVVREDDGTKTAYYFSCPIYNQKTRKLVDMKFRQNGDTIYAVGSNADISLSQNLLMENAEGAVSLELFQKPMLVSPREARFDSCIVSPTTNGVVIKCDVKNVPVYTFSIETRQPHLNVMANDRYFALMKEKFRPFVVLSCLGSLDSDGNIIAPARIEYQKLTDNKYQIALFATTPLAKYVLFEANLYENKLFQDTTVESMNPSTNNAFGGVGFIGNTSLYGEQWLYSRLDYSRLPEIMDKQIQKAVLHMPKFDKRNTELSAQKVSARFCSFGSNWDNKISGGMALSDSLLNNAYQSLDLTDSITEQRTKTMISSEGIILKLKNKGSGFSVIATGDSCFAPQILEVNYR